MTKKEAIKIIKGLVGTLEFSASQEDALIVAIESLQTETIPLLVADKIGEERERLQDKVAELQEEIAELQEKIADRPHGEWIEEYTDMNGDKWYRCSHCGERFVLIEKGEASTEPYHFCPNCDARMKGGDEE